MHPVRARSDGPESRHLQPCESFHCTSCFLCFFNCECTLRSWSAPSNLCEEHLIISDSFVSHDANKSDV